MGEGLVRVAVLASSYPLQLGLQAMLSQDASLLLVNDEDHEPPEVIILAGRTAPPGNTAARVILVEPEFGLAPPFSWDPATPGGLLSLSASADELCAAVRAAAAGLWVGDRWLAEGLRRLPTALAPGDEEPLTPRETEVLERLAAGLANKQIAAALGLSENTVKFHLASIYSKLGASNRAEAVRLGARRGLISL